MICGVVAEFNPFHNGHKYQLDEINKLNPDIKIALISGDFVQRGELSILSTYDKTRIALEMGYDIVAAIPDKYSIQNAEIYCSFAVKILNELGVDYQIFGVESNDISDIYALIETVENVDIKPYLKQGYSYNKSISLALGDKSYLYTSNNILAMEYIKAIKKYNLNIKPLSIKRINTDYNDQIIRSNFASASKIRELIKSNESFEYLVPYKHKLNYIHSYEEKLFSLFKYIFLTRNNDNIYDMTKEIYNIIKNKLKISNNYFDFINNINCRNVSKTRIKRLMLNVILNIKDFDINKEDEIKEIKILGLNKKGGKYIKNIEKAYVDYSQFKESEEGFLLLKEYLFESKKFNKLIYWESEK
ncbi:nucleotidyltransferase family protein [Caviibacter abscessus]|uniref:nucleotidyltransferase family protein n=1 Tax=Caviibacter abscessus TaxID=1766719 RepID=UPI00082CDC65|nr:nucleotidyltransferase family protein [Caviibacter abscessus]